MLFRQATLASASLLLLSLSSCMASQNQIRIIDTGSTNRPGRQLTFEANGTGSLASPGAAPQAIRLDAALCKQLAATVRSLPALSTLPAASCMKSASFGSRLYVEYHGERSPDLACPTGNDRRLATLKQQATRLLETAKADSRLR